MKIIGWLLLAGMITFAGCSAGNDGSTFIPTPYSGPVISISPTSGTVQTSLVSGDMVFVKVGSLFVQESEVTCDQWRSVMLSSPWTDTSAVAAISGGAPALNVSWDDAMAFASAMKTKSSLNVRLPTAAEWSSWYATAYPWGDDPAYGLRSQYAQVRETAPVGVVRLAAAGSPYNGMYNLVGNAREWTSDGYLCGGGWSDNILLCTRTQKIASVPTSVRHPASGFRLVISQ